MKKKAAARTERLVISCKPGGKELLRNALKRMGIKDSLDEYVRKAIIEKLRSDGEIHEWVKFKLKFERDIQKQNEKASG